VRWYLRFKLSLRDLVEMMAERGLSLAHTTIMRWVRHYTPEFGKRWRRFALAVGRSWRVDETYVKIRGEWCYLQYSVPRSVRIRSMRISCASKNGITRSLRMSAAVSGAGRGRCAPHGSAPRPPVPPIQAVRQIMSRLLHLMNSGRRQWYLAPEAAVDPPEPEKRMRSRT
jgi:DDE domain